MALLTILISLVLEKFLPPLEKFRSLGWFAHYSDWVRTRLARHPRLQGTAALLITILVPVIIVGVAQTLFANILSLLAFLFSIAVFSYCLGPNNPLYVAHQYQDALEGGDEETAQSTLALLLPEGIPEPEPARAIALIETVLIQTHERMLGIIFWFVILGPMGAALYTLAVHQSQRERQDAQTDNPRFRSATIRLHALLAWIPCRLTALSYAITGSFAQALQDWEAPQSGESTEATTDSVPITPDSHGLLLRVGLGALQFDDEPPKDTSTVRETFALCLRSVIAWLTILALLTLAGWAG